jgi:hypothetical protein
MTARLAALATRLARAGGPLARRRERAARAAIGMPARHPERLTAELPGRDEQWLAALAAELWPEDEYAQIVRDTRPDSGLS